MNVIVPFATVVENNVHIQFTASFTADIKQFFVICNVADQTLLSALDKAIMSSTCGEAKKARALSISCCVGALRVNVSVPTLVEFQ